MCGGRGRGGQEWKRVGSGPIKMSGMETCAWDTARYQQGIRVPTEWESQFGRALGPEGENNNYLSTSLLASSSSGGPAAPSLGGTLWRGLGQKGLGWAGVGGKRERNLSACWRGILSEFSLPQSHVLHFSFCGLTAGRERVKRARPDGDGGLAGMPRWASRLEEQPSPRHGPDPQNPALESFEPQEPPARRCHLSTFSSSPSLLNAGSFQSQVTTANHCGFSAGLSLFVAARSEMSL